MLRGRIFFLKLSINNYKRILDGKKTCTVDCCFAPCSLLIRPFCAYTKRYKPAASPRNLCSKKTDTHCIQCISVHASYTYICWGKHTTTVRICILRRGSRLIWWRLAWNYSLEMTHIHTLCDALVHPHLKSDQMESFDEEKLAIYDPRALSLARFVMCVWWYICSAKIYDGQYSANCCSPFAYTVYRSLAPIPTIIPR